MRVIYQTHLLPRDFAYESLKAKMQTILFKQKNDARPFFHGSFFFHMIDFQSNSFSIWIWRAFLRMNFYSSIHDFCMRSKTCTDNIYYVLLSNWICRSYITHLSAEVAAVLLFDSTCIGILFFLPHRIRIRAFFCHTIQYRMLFLCRFIPLCMHIWADIISIWDSVQLFFQTLLKVVRITTAKKKRS